MEDARPHTLSWLAVMLALLFPVFFLNVSEVASPERDLRLGLGASGLVFLFYCSLQLQDGELTRPHVVVWRLVHGVTILYLLLVVLLLAQNSASAVDRIVTLVFNQPESGRAALPRHERNEYSENCELTLGNLENKVFDRYFAAHLVGWIVKALILRDWQMMWACSLLFEVFEVSLQQLLPNFSECWWDRWLLDVFGCNLLGMCIGMKLASALGAREYDWRGGKPRQFYSRFDWHVFGSWRYFGIAAMVLFVVMLGELNGFFIKSSLRLGPRQSWLILWRIVLIVPAVYASVVELYAFAQQRAKQIGRTAWLVVCLGVLEFLLAMKQFYLCDAFSPEQLRHPHNAHVACAWLASLGFGAVVAALKLSKTCSTRAIHHVAKLAALPFAALLWNDAWEYGGLRQLLKYL